MPEYRFDEIAILRNEKRIPVPEDKYTYVGLEHLDSGKLEVTRWGSEVDIKGEKLVMHKGDILFGRRNTYLKRAAIAPHDGLFSAHGMIFRPNTKVISERLFPFFIASDYFMDAAIRISVGSLSPTVNWKTLRELKFKLPPLEQQNELADLMQAANDTKVAYEQMLLQIDELVKSQFIEMFGDPLLNEKAWPKKKLKETCSLMTGNTPSRKVPEYYGQFVEWIKSDNIPKDSAKLSKAAEFLSESGANVGRLVDPGTILMTCIAGSLNTIGNIAITDRQVAFNQQINAIVPKQYDVVFLYHLLMQMKPVLHEATSCSLKCILNKGNLESIEAILPDKRLQEEFAKIAEQSDKSKFELKQAIERVTNLMKSLMQQDFAN